MPRWAGYQLFRHEYRESNSLIDNGVNAVCATADGTLWFGTNLGLSAYHPASGRWTHSLRGRVVLALCPSDDGGVWAGTYGNGVFSVSATGTAKAAYARSLGNLSSECITSLACDHLGRLWVGAIDGALSCIVDGKAHQLPIREVECLKAVGGKMAVGTTAGFCVVNISSWRFERYFNPGDFGDKDICCFINSIIADGSHAFWLGTDGGGIYHYDTRTRKYWQISTRQGVPSNTIAGICHGAHGLLMISTDRGLCTFNVRTRRVRQLSIYEGLDQEYNRMACWQLPDGKLLFGGNDGGVLLSPDAVLPSHYSAQLRVTSILPLDTKQVETVTCAGASSTCCVRKGHPALCPKLLYRGTLSASTIAFSTTSDTSISLKAMTSNGLPCSVCKASDTPTCRQEAIRSISAHSAVPTVASLTQRTFRSSSSGPGGIPILPGSHICSLSCPLSICFGVGIVTGWNRDTTMRRFLSLSIRPMISARAAQPRAGSFGRHG